MVYASAGILALLLNAILNWRTLSEVTLRSNHADQRQRVINRYGWFLIAANFFFITDILWGILDQYHTVPGVFPFLYSDTVFYFIFMLLTMLTWSRYVVAYLNKNNYASRLLLFTVWTVFAIGVVELMFNRFHPFIFSFDSEHSYIPEAGRTYAFLLQVIFYFLTAGHMLGISFRTVYRLKIRYRAVALTCLSLGAFLGLQVFDASLPFYSVGLMVGIAVIHTFVEVGEKKEKQVHDHIASVMAEDYEVIYYIDLETGDYLEFSKSDKYRSMDVPSTGKDFFGETIENIKTYVYPDDIPYATAFYSKEAMLKNLEGRRSFSYKYRVLVGGEPRYFLFTVMRDSGGQYLVFYEKDIQDELMAEKKQRENQKKTVTFSQIAESLASNYDEIYYVNIATSSYASYEVNNIYGQLEVSSSGGDFFRDSYNTIPQIIHKQDREMVMEFLNKDYLLSALEGRKGTGIDYRITMSGKTHYLRMTVHKTSDGSHFIVGVENIDDEIKREKQHMRALQSEKELARRDELTGIKNKNAYMELAESVQGNMDNGMDYLPFGLVVCDANNLKLINDTQGHAAGDEYIKASARLLCDIFVHSPVFRVGGDEFAVFLRGSDYSRRESLMKRLRDQVLENKKTGSGPVLASGMAEYEPKNDNFVAEVFERADKEMYENKQDLKRD
jgi:diguanylate cyclase (GGDEF)-like protein